MSTILAVSHGRKTYFDLFNLPIEFSVDTTRLSERYLTLLDSGQSTSFRDGGSTGTALPARPRVEIELAYRTLADPLARAAYLLDLLDGQAADHPDGHTHLGADLMAEMELRDSLTQASNRPDPAATVANILTLLAEQGASLEKELRRLLDDPSQRNLDAAREILRRLELVGNYRRDAQDRRAAFALRA